MENHSQTAYERYKTEIYRIGWRLQYRAKKLKKNECILVDQVIPQNSFASNVIDKIVIEQLLDSIPENGRNVIEKDIFGGIYRSRCCTSARNQSTGGE